MTNEELFAEISRNITNGYTDGVTASIYSIAESSDDPYELLKCMSLLKVVPDDGTISRIGCKLVGMVKDDETSVQVIAALRSLDCPTFALELVKKTAPSDELHRLHCLCLMDMEEYESAMDHYKDIAEPTKGDRIMLVEIQSAVGEHTMAINTANQLMSEYPKDYDVRIAYVSAMMLGGHDKEVAKYAREVAKEKTADAYAVAAYVLRIVGNIKAAGGYASRAVQIDNEHIGALETLGICLAMKGEKDKAKIVAGAINEVSPGNKAAMNILSYCD